jgi:multimeric flavodoxin WrbA
MNGMTKKVVILSASPRKGGNSDLLCDQFLRGAQEAGHQAGKIVLREKKIGYCVACDACQKNGGRCGQQDDMAGILEQMIAADVIVMATPVYFYTMNAQMKTLIDRCYARYTAISGKEFYFIMTAAVGQKSLLERTLESLRGFTACLDGAKERGVVYGTGAWQVGEIKKSPALGEAYEMGKTA